MPSDPTRNVFVVHGRNLSARDAVFDFLRAIDLHPLEWEELITLTAETSPHISRVLEVGFSVCQAAVILITPDEVGSLRPNYRSRRADDGDDRQAGQPRLNVVFEAGAAFALFPDRTVILQYGEARTWSDIAGRHTLRVGATDRWRHDLAGRLETAGCSVNTAGNDWQTAGVFSTEIRERYTYWNSAESRRNYEQLLDRVDLELARSVQVELSEKELAYVLTSAIQCAFDVPYWLSRNITSPIAAGLMVEVIARARGGRRPRWRAARALEAFQPDLFDGSVALVLAQDRNARLDSLSRRLLQCVTDGADVLELLEQDLDLDLGHKRDLIDSMEGYPSRFNAVVVDL